MQPVLACYGTNEGASWRYAVNIAQGAKSNVDLEDADPNLSNTIAHPLQWSSAQSVDLVGWGTYKGHGVTSGCPDDHTGWNVYVDGKSFGDYFCRFLGTALPDNGQISSLGETVRGTRLNDFASS